MRLIDRALRAIGLMRCSQMPIEHIDIEWKLGAPTHVDIELTTGQRVVGHVDPWYPNEAPDLFTHPTNPLVPERN